MEYWHPRTLKIIDSPEMLSLLLSSNALLLWVGWHNGAQNAPDRTKGKDKALTSTQLLCEALRGPGVDLSWMGWDVPVLHVPAHEAGGSPHSSFLQQPSAEPIWGWKPLEGQRQQLKVLRWRVTSHLHETLKPRVRCFSSPHGASRGSVPHEPQLRGTWSAQTVGKGLTT